MMPRLDRFTEFLLFESLGADELDVLNFHLGCLMNFENGGGAPRTLLDFVGVFDFRAWGAGLLIRLLNLFRVGEEFAFVERFARFCGWVFSQLLFPVPGVVFEFY